MGLFGKPNSNCVYSEEMNAQFRSSNAAVFTALKTLIAQGAKMQASLDALTAQVAANNTVIGSATVLIQGFSAQLAAAGTDPAKLDALKASLASSDAALAAAVAANTPAVS